MRIACGGVPSASWTVLRWGGVPAQSRVELDCVSDKTRHERANCASKVVSVTPDRLTLEVRRSSRNQDVMTMLLVLVGSSGDLVHLRSNIELWHVTSGNPWNYLCQESVSNRVRDENMNRDEFASLMEAQALSAGWQWDENEAMPFSSPQYLADGVRRALAYFGWGYIPAFGDWRGNLKS